MKKLFYLKATLSGLLCLVTFFTNAQDTTKVKTPLLNFGFYHSSVDEKFEYFQTDLSYYFTSSLGSSASIGLIRSWKMPVLYSEEFYVGRMPYDRTYVYFGLKFNFRPINSKKHSLVLSGGGSMVKIDEIQAHHVHYETLAGGIIEHQYSSWVYDLLLFGHTLEIEYSYFLSDKVGLGCKLISKRYKVEELVHTLGVENISIGLFLKYKF